jgi:hypothetical protein
LFVFLLFFSYYDKANQIRALAINLKKNGAVYYFFFVENLKQIIKKEK